MNLLTLIPLLLLLVLLQLAPVSASDYAVVLNTNATIVKVTLVIPKPVQTRRWQLNPRQYGQACNPSL